MQIEIVPRRVLTLARYLETVRLCEQAYDEDDDIAGLMADFTEATHVLLIDAEDRLISHALWVERLLSYGTERLRTAYVELVATDPNSQHQGHASAVMRALGDAIAGYDIGALSPSDSAFYARFGWKTWRGPLFEHHPHNAVVPSPAAELVMILQRPGGPDLDLEEPLTAPWRSGEIW